MTYKEFIEELQREMNEMGEKLTVDGDPGKFTKAALAKYDVEMTLTPIVKEVPSNVIHLPSHYFGATWVGANIDLLGRREDDPELNARYVPGWAKVGLRGYNTLVGTRHAWCILKMIEDYRKVGVDVKGLNAGAKSLSGWGVECPFWFGAGLPIKHGSKGGRHAAVFLYWINEKKRIAATMDGNRSNLFDIFATDLSGSGDFLVGGPRWPKGWPDGKLVSMSEVLAAYPQLKVRGTGSSTR